MTGEHATGGPSKGSRGHSRAAATNTCVQQGRMVCRESNKQANRQGGEQEHHHGVHAPAKMECWDRRGTALAGAPAAVLPLLGPSSWENGQAAPRVQVPRPKNLQGWAGTCQSKGGVRAGMSKRPNVASTSWMRQGRPAAVPSAPPHRSARGKGRVPPWARNVGAADACPAGAHRHLLPLPETGQNRLGVAVLTPVTLPGGVPRAPRGCMV